MIGKTIWRFDINRRVYRERKKGEHAIAVGGPIWREHWRPEIVKSETSRSWITNYGSKVPKKGADPRTFVFSEEELTRAAFVADNSYLIGDAVGRIRDYDTLKAIADLIGYTPKD